MGSLLLCCFSCDFVGLMITLVWFWLGTLIDLGLGCVLVVTGGVLFCVARIRFCLRLDWFNLVFSFAIVLRRVLE